MRQYLEIVGEVLRRGVQKSTRTSVDVLSISGRMFQHEMAEGFPLLTTKKIPYRLPASELEFFIQGITDKQWLQERGNHIWDEWCTPKKVPYGNDDDTKARMMEERDLGPIYGFQWRHFGARYEGYEGDYAEKGFDQLAKVVETLKKDPTDRRMIVSSWNPLDKEEMALPPCHYSFQVGVSDGRLDLSWTQRSVDVMLGLPFNIASYATLLHLLAKEGGFKEGVLTGFLQDTHIYKTHLEGAREQVTREPLTLPRIETSHFTSIFDWGYTDSRVVDYRSHPSIKFEIAV